MYFNDKLFKFQIIYSSIHYFYDYFVILIHAIFSYKITKFNIKCN